MLQIFMQNNKVFGKCKFCTRAPRFTFKTTLLLEAKNRKYYIKSLKSLHKNDQKGFFLFKTPQSTYNTYCAIRS